MESEALLFGGPPAIRTRCQGSVVGAAVLVLASGSERRYSLVGLGTECFLSEFFIYIYLFLEFVRMSLEFLVLCTIFGVIKYS